MSDTRARTARPVLVFDGDCGFCTSSARFGERWLRLERVEPYQRLDLAELGLTAEQCADAAQWVDEAGRTSSAEDAAIAAMRFAGGIWGVLGRIVALPGIHRLAGVAYRLIARNRHRLPGGTPACRL